MRWGRSSTTSCCCDARRSPPCGPRAHELRSIHPRPKPRPALILAVFDDDAPQFTVRVAYGTSQRTTALHRGEFSILRERNAAAYAAAGLSYDTKFDLGQALDLPYSTQWFSVPPAAPHGQCPKLGVLHPSLVRAVQTAYQAAST